MNDDAKRITPEQIEELLEQAPARTRTIGTGKSAKLVSRIALQL
ncbi:MAG: hypothetical protein V4482_03935 [Pseudomonadota bacterium]